MPLSLSLSHPVVLELLWSRTDLKRSIGSGLKRISTWAFTWACTDMSHLQLRFLAVSLGAKGSKLHISNSKNCKMQKIKFRLIGGLSRFVWRSSFFFADTATFVVCPCHTFWPSKIKLGGKMSFEKRIFWEVHFFSPYYYLLCGGSKCPFVTFDTCKS